ncbi:hypothetical protein Lsan_3385 [Legionella santicrucis]|uniref:Uncharacterized protein n=1 Tax=Legionella santicrucis TaxID=45074 RepID=A0A0W0YFV7_9GAMM|nr:hypothetical protein [Legionella santicrucis]KTD55833.1 hypothetical protein Lsan_3385 [Legionella santicrucis]
MLNQFAENIKNLPDATLQDVESGKLVISLTPAVGNEAGGATTSAAAAKKAAELKQISGVSQAVSTYVKQTKPI